MLAHRKRRERYVSPRFARAHERLPTTTELTSHSDAPNDRDRNIRVYVCVMVRRRRRAIAHAESGGCPFGIAFFLAV